MEALRDEPNEIEMRERFNYAQSRRIRGGRGSEMSDLNISLEEQFADLRSVAWLMNG